jgi:hypothetical protein
LDYQAGASINIGLGAVDLGVSAGISGRAFAASDASSVPTESAGCRVAAAVADCLMPLLGGEVDGLRAACSAASSSREGFGAAQLPALDGLWAAAEFALSSISAALDSAAGGGDAGSIAGVLEDVLSSLTGALSSLTPSGGGVLECLESALGGYVSGAFSAVSSLASGVQSLLSGGTGLSLLSGLTGLLALASSSLSTVESSMRSVLGEMVSLGWLIELICPDFSGDGARIALGGGGSPFNFSGLVSVQGGGFTLGAAVATLGL